MGREIQIRSVAVSLFILRPAASKFEVLLLRRLDEILSGEWCQVAGHIELGETAWQAALREAREETGLELVELYSADICEQYYEADRDSIALTPVFVAYTREDCEVRLNAEHSDFRWLSPDDAAPLFPFAGQRAILTHIVREFMERVPNALLRISPATRERR